jgi:hypothetical protein
VSARNTLVVKAIPDAARLLPAEAWHRFPFAVERHTMKLNELADGGSQHKIVRSCDRLKAIHPTLADVHEDPQHVSDFGAMIKLYAFD